MTEPAKRLRPPGGHPPPTVQSLGDGTELDLQSLAAEICDRYRAEFPDEQGRYGDAGVAWCRHDNQHLLNWAALGLRGFVDFDRELEWLAGVLEARDFPLERLARNLEIASEVVSERVGSEEARGLAAKLRDGAELVRPKPGPPSR